MIFIFSIQACADQSPDKPYYDTENSYCVETCSTGKWLVTTVEAYCQPECDTNNDEMLVFNGNTFECLSNCTDDGYIQINGYCIYATSCYEISQLQIGSISQYTDLVDYKFNNGSTCVIKCDPFYQQSSSSPEKYECTTTCSQYLQYELDGNIQCSQTCELFAQNITHDYGSGSNIYNNCTETCDSAYQYVLLNNGVYSCEQYCTSSGTPFLYDQIDINGVQVRNCTNYCATYSSDTITQINFVIMVQENEYMCTTTCETYYINNTMFGTQINRECVDTCDYFYQLDSQNDRECVGSCTSQIFIIDEMGNQCISNCDQIGQTYEIVNMTVNTTGTPTQTELRHCMTENCSQSINGTNMFLQVDKKQCLDNCSTTYYNTYNQGIKQCQSAACEYYSEYDTNLSISHCITDCSYSIFNNTILYAEANQCISNCFLETNDNYIYQYEKQCYQSCPTNTYMNGYQCTLRCPSGCYTTTAQGKNCTSQCLSYFQYVGDQKECLQSCGSMYIYNNNQCVASCSSTTDKFVINQTFCASQCPTYAPYVSMAVGGAYICDSKCDIGTPIFNVTSNMTMCSLIGSDYAYYEPNYNEIQLQQSVSLSNISFSQYVLLKVPITTRSNASTIVEINISTLQALKICIKPNYLNTYCSYSFSQVGNYEMEIDPFTLSSNYLYLQVASSMQSFQTSPVMLNNVSLNLINFTVKQNGFTSSLALEPIYIAIIVVALLGIILICVTIGLCCNRKARIERRVRQIREMQDDKQTQCGFDGPVGFKPFKYKNTKNSAKRKSQQATIATHRRQSQQENDFADAVVCEEVQPSYAPQLFISSRMQK